MITKGSFRILATGFIHSRSQSVITWTTNMNINATNQAQVTLIRLLCTYKRTESVRLRAQLNPIKAIVRLCSSIGKLQLSDYSWLWENRFIGQFTSGPCYFSDSLMSRLNRDMEAKGTMALIGLSCAWKQIDWFNMNLLQNLLIKIETFWWKHWIPFLYNFTFYFWFNNFFWFLSLYLLLFLTHYLTSKQCSMCVCHMCMTYVIYVGECHYLW